jgi:hypothetical protein
MLLRKRRLPLLATRSRQRSREAPCTRSAPHHWRTTHDDAINGWSVNRQLSMTPCPRLAAGFLYWRRAWVDCHSPLMNAGLPAKTEDEQRAVTSAKSAPITQSSGASDTHRGGLSQPSNPVLTSASQPQKTRPARYLHVSSMNWRGGSSLSRPQAPLDNIFLPLISLITVETMQE